MQRYVFPLTKRVKTQQQRFVHFETLLYTKALIEAPLAAEAPKKDLDSLDSVYFPWTSHFLNNQNC